MMQTPLRPGDMCFSPHTHRLNGVLCLAAVPHEPRKNDQGIQGMACITYVLLRYEQDEAGEGPISIRIDTCERDEHAFKLWLSIDERQRHT